MRQMVTLLRLVDGLYEEQVFRGDEQLVSPMLPNLELTAERVIKAGIS